MFKPLIMMCSVKITISDNNIPISKYLAAMKYATMQHSKIIQDVDREQYSGIQNNKIEDHLINVLMYLPLGDTKQYEDYNGMYYADSKSYLLLEGDYYSQYNARNLINIHLKTLIEQYGLKVDDSMSNEELYLTYQTALYFKQLSENSDFSFNIPEEYK